MEIKIENPTNIDRTVEMVEIPLQEIYEQLEVSSFDHLMIIDEQGNPKDFQITYNEQLIFLAEVNAQSVSTYGIIKGTPPLMDTLALGRQYPERLDDVAWENDLIAYRAYGPAFQESGALAFGYDVWVKSVTHPVVEDRYRKDLQESISYHVDHGDGLDCYQVGPTLGAGANALLDKGQIVYPNCYTDYKILDNGPLRFTVCLTYAPFTIGDNKNVKEHRILSLDVGCFLNYTSVSYENLETSKEVLAGIVMHHPHDSQYTINDEVGFMAYLDPTEDTKRENGSIFIGLSFPEGFEKGEVMTLSSGEEQHAGKNVLGHLVGKSVYVPGTQFNYYWGAAWSKVNFSDLEEWSNYLSNFTFKKKNPLIVSF